MLGVESIGNFRSLGGQTTVDHRQVRSGLVYRSGHLADASDGDLEAMAALGIRTVFEFRNEEDIAAEGPNRLPAGVELVSLPMVDPASGPGLREQMASSSTEELEERFGNGRAFEWMKRASGRSVSDPNRAAQFGEFVQGLLAPDAAPALFNCSAGKDRTGWAASILLMAVGVPEDQVLDHYVETNRHINPSRLGDLLMPLTTVHEDYFAEQIRVLEETWGTFDRYWTDGLGLDDGHLESLQELLLED